MNNYVNTRKSVLSSINEDKTVFVLFSGSAMLKTCDQFFPFEPNRNFYYMTGIDKPKLIFMAIKDGDSIKETLFIERYDELKAKWDGKTIDENFAKKISGIENIKYLDEFDKTICSAIFSSNIKNIYLDLENRYMDTHRDSFKFCKKIKENFPEICIKNSYHTIGDFRLIKKDYEIDMIKNAIKITKKGIENIFKNTEPNIMEYELEACFDYAIKKEGAKDLAFNTILASGENATVLHYQENNNKINDGELILIDLGASYSYYSSDISRTFPANKKFSERQKQLYNIVLVGQQKVIDIIKEGTPFAKLNETLIKYYEDELLKIGLIKEKSEVSKYYFHGVSHHLGLDTHDVAKKTEANTLKAGMVITVEPGLYIPEEKIGIRIEDDILVTKDGYINLSSDIIKTVDEIENFLKNS